ncbi:MAG: lmo0937 family membrane protein [Weeksellaceae bacterium]|nr:lmo0937 family membrane protein [Weeksellaceae bacterium]
MDKILNMKDNILYIMAAVLFFGWMIGYMLFDIGGIFHLTFLFAVLVILLKLIKDYTR